MEPSGRRRQTSSIPRSGIPRRPRSVMSAFKDDFKADTSDLMNTKEPRPKRHSPTNMFISRTKFKVSGYPWAASHVTHHLLSDVETEATG